MTATEMNTETISAPLQPELHISVQHEDFDIAKSSSLLSRSSLNTGAVVTFTGLVRDQNLGDNVIGLYLEHYPGMTEKVLKDIALQAFARWPFIAMQVIHRIGELHPSDQIVFVGVSSPHRRNAFNACEFMMDFLKTSAPFWKKELTADGNSRWLDARDCDTADSQRWLEPQKNDNG